MDPQFCQLSHDSYSAVHICAVFPSQRISPASHQSIISPQPIKIIAIIAINNLISFVLQ
jgi:hypothetical protein